MSTHWFMKFRAFILLTCMFVVPALAMFSHRMPTAVRDNLRQNVWNPIHDAVATVARALSPSTEPAASTASPFLAADPSPVDARATPAPAPAAPAPRPPATAGPTTPARVVMPTVPLAPVNTIAEQAPPEGNGLAVPVATARAAERSFTQPPRRPQPATPTHAALAPEPSTEQFTPAPRAGAAPPQPSSDPPLAAVSPGSDAVAIRQRLTDLGAFGIECQPLAGGGAGYASACRMPIDPSGELQRMFHGSGPDAASAMHSLMHQVETWKRQQAGEARL